MVRLKVLLPMLVIAATTVRADDSARVERIYTDEAGNHIVEQVATVSPAAELGPARLPRWTPVMHAPLPEPPRWSPVDSSPHQSAIVAAQPGPVLPVEPERPAVRHEAAPILPVGGCGHAADYSWLVGTLEYVHARQQWTVRFAPVDREDRYGGSVTLTETGSMSQFRSGQRVRVTGGLAKPETRTPAPAYRVATIRVKE